jgi:hypothetical protein
MLRGVRFTNYLTSQGFTYTVQARLWACLEEVGTQREGTDGLHLLTW